MDMNVLPPDLFVAGVPSAMRGSAPVVIDSDDGPMWSLAGTILGPSGRACKSHHPERPRIRPAPRAQRLEDMDRDGIHRTLSRPHFAADPDPEVRAACMAGVQRWAATSTHRSQSPRVLACAVAHARGGTAELKRLPRSATGAIVAFSPVPIRRSKIVGAVWARANELAMPIASIRQRHAQHQVKPAVGAWPRCRGVADAARRSVTA